MNVMQWLGLAMILVMIGWLVMLIDVIRYRAGRGRYKRREPR